MMEAVGSSDNFTSIVKGLVGGVDNGANPRDSLDFEH